MPARGKWRQVQHSHDLARRSLWRCLPTAAKVQPAHILHSDFQSLGLAMLVVKKVAMPTLADSPSHMECTSHHLVFQGIEKGQLLAGDNLPVRITAHAINSWHFNGGTSLIRWSPKTSYHTNSHKSTFCNLSNLHRIKIHDKASDFPEVNDALQCCHRNT